MIQIDKVEVTGWEPAIRGMRNPMNSWDKSDSDFLENHEELGSYDMGLMKRLRDSGTDHRKYMRMIAVYADITAPLYWWKEFDTYKVGTVANSCSTMHKIGEKEFTVSDFSFEHLEQRVPDQFERIYRRNGIDVTMSPYGVLDTVITYLNIYRDLYLKTKNKEYWWQMIQLLPSSYNQKRTIMLNYEVLANMYKSRKNHKLDEWIAFCCWMDTLPYSWIISKDFEETSHLSRGK